MGAESIIKVVVTGDVKGLHHATDDALKDVQKTGKESGTAGKQIAAGFAVGAGAALAFGVQAVEAADVADKAHVRLETAVKNAGDQWDTYGKQIKGAVDQGVQFGYDQGQIEAALATMTTGLGSTKKALDALPLAQNIAAQTGMDLSASALLVTKAEEGQSKVLKKLGIDLPVAAAGALKVKTSQEAVTKAETALQLIEEKIHDGRLKGPAAADALRTANDNLKTAQGHLNDAQSAGAVLTDALTKRYQGAAGKEADTFAGKVAAQAAEWRNVKIQAGQAIENGLLKFQTWSQKTGRPEIMRLQGDLSLLGQTFVGVETDLLGLLVKLDTFTSKIKPLITLGGNLEDAWANVFGGGGTGQGTPGAAQRDRQRLDAINKQKAQASKTHSPAHPTGPAQVSATTINITVQGADPNTVITAAAKYARRNGARVK